MIKQITEALGKCIKENIDIIDIIELAKRIENEVEEETTLVKAITKYGAEAQEGVAQEECAELIQAISKKHRGKPHNITEEIADVEIMLEQLKIINGCEDEVKEIRKQKIKRLEHKMRGVMNGKDN